MSNKPLNNEGFGTYFQNQINALDSRIVADFDLYSIYWGGSKI